jgi:hypothetical protein
MESIGFKEWAVVCEALGRGEQSIMVRKGGIAEGREGFTFRHREFFLFPTWFHEQPEKVREIDFEFPQATAGRIDIKYSAALDVVKTIASLKTVEALAPLHILKSEVLRERFEYNNAPGVHIALVRVFRLVPQWTIVDESRYDGCRSWVNLPPVPAGLRLEPIVGDADHAVRRDRFLHMVGSDEFSG